MPANNVVELIFRATNQTNAGIRSVTQDIQRLEQSLPLAGIGRLGAAISGVGIGALTLGAGLRTLIKHGLDTQESMQNLAGAVLVAGKNFNQLGTELEGTVSKLQRASRFDSTEIRRGLTTLIQLSGEVKASEQTLAAVADFAAARHLAFADAAELVAKGSEGMIMALRRSGIGLQQVAKDAFDLLTPTQRLQLGIAGTATGLDTLAQKAFEALTPTERLGVIAGLLNEKFGGAAARDLGTYAGQLAHIRAEAGNLADTLGTKLVQALAEAAVRIRTSLGEMSGKGFGISIPDIVEQARRMQAVSALSAKEQDDIIRSIRLIRERKKAEEEGGKTSAQTAAEELAKGAIRAAQEAARLKAQQEAAANALKYQEILNGLLGTNKDQAMTERAVAEAIRIVNQQTGNAAAGATIFAEQLDKIDETARKTGGHIRADLIPQIERLHAMLQLGASLDAILAPSKAWVLAVEAMRTEGDVLVNQWAAMASAGIPLNEIATVMGAAFAALGEKAQKAGISFGDLHDSTAAALDTMAHETAIASFTEKLRQLGEQGSRTNKELEDLRALSMKIGMETLFSGATPLQIAAKFQPQLQTVLPEFQRTGTIAGLTAEELDRLRPSLKITADLESFKRAAAEFAEQMKRSAEDFGQNLGALFSDLASTGGKNFGEIAAQAFNRLVQEGAKDLGTRLATMLQNAFSPVQEAPGGGFTFAGSTQTFESRDAAMTAFLQTGQKPSTGQILGSNALNFAAIGFGSYQAARQGQSLLAGTISGAAAGSAINLGWGTLIGAVVGFLGSVLAPSPGKDYPYARFGVRQGQAFFEPTQNIDANAAKQALANIQKAYDSAIGDLVRTLLRIPTEFLPQMFASIGELLPKVGKDAGGDIGRAASQSFWKDFQLWFQQGMPRDLAEHFRPIFAQAFEGMGFTVSRFNEIWAALQDMDPADARKALDDLTSAVVGMRENFKYLGQSAGGLLATGAAANQQTMAQQLHDSATEITRLADAFNSLPISQQITAAAEINRLTKERVDLERQFFQELAATIKDVTNSFDAQIRDLTAQGLQTKEGKPDLQAQAQYYLDYANSLRARIAAAATPQEAQALGQELQSTIGTILQLGQQMGPAAGEAFRKWAIETLTQGRDIVLDRLHELGDAVAQENADFVKRIQGPWEEFTGQATSAADALNDLVTAVNSFKDWLLRGSPPGGPGGPGTLPISKDFGGVGGPTDPSDVFDWPEDPNAGTGQGGPGKSAVPGRGVRPFDAGQAQITDGEQAVTIGQEIGASLVAALSRSDALKAIAAAGAGLRTLSQTTPLPVISVTAPKPEVTVTPAPPAPPVVVPPPVVVTPPPPSPPAVDTRGRDAALSAIAALLGRLTDKGIPDLTDALSGAGGAFPALPTGFDTPADYIPTYTPGHVPATHPFFSLNDPNSPVLTPDIWASWNVEQRRAGVPETPRPNSMRALEAAINKFEDSNSKGQTASTKALIEWLKAIFKELASADKGPITIVLPPAPVITKSAGPSTRRLGG
jgi:hypothetical protein